MIVVLFQYLLPLLALAVVPACRVYQFFLVRYSDALDAHFTKQEELDGILADLDREFPAALALPVETVPVPPSVPVARRSEFPCSPYMVLTEWPVAKPDGCPDDLANAWRDRPERKRFA